jgi:large subunit ribosomal protein L18Ae
VGRALPTEENPNPELYRMRVFERDAVLARSKFWYHMKRQHKVRKIQGEIISTSEIFEKKSNCLRNYGIFIRYLTRTGTINMYKEYRDNTLCGAVSQMYMEMSGRHSARGETIQIIRTSVLNDSQLRRANVSQFVGNNVRFPKTDQRVRAPSKRLSNRIRAIRPTLIA